MTQKHLKLHNRATCILEMIERCDRARNISINYLSTNFAAPWFHYTKGYYEIELKKYSAIKSRLVAYYADVMERLIRPAMESNVRVFGDIPGITAPTLERYAK